jgi:hypothetical protein
MAMEHENVMVTASKDSDDYGWCEDNCDGMIEGEDESQFLFKNAYGDILEELEDRFETINVM